MNLRDGGSQHFPFRHLDRVTQILRVAARHGWSHYVDRLELARYLPGGQTTAQNVHAESDATRLRSALEELGPTFVKFGQLLSVQREFSP